MSAAFKRRKTWRENVLPMSIANLAKSNIINEPHVLNILLDSRHDFFCEAFHLSNMY